MQSEALLRAQYQTIVKERDGLLTRFEQLERENKELRRSVYELSLQLSQLSPTSIFEAVSKGSKWKSVGLIEDQLTSSLPLLPFTVDTTSTGDRRQISYQSELKGHTGSVYCMDVSYDGLWIASGSLDKNILVWKGNFPHKQIASLSGHTQLISGIAWGLERGGDFSGPDDAPLPPVLYSSSFDKTVGRPILWMESGHWPVCACGQAYGCICVYNHLIATIPMICACHCLSGTHMECSFGDLYSSGEAASLWYLHYKYTS